MAVAALDPWVFEFDAADYEIDRASKALLDYGALIDNHPDLEPLPFVDPGIWERAAAKGYPVHSGDYARLLGSLCIAEDRGVISDSVSLRWHFEVAAVLRGDRTPHWRDPLICVPSCREDSWPTTNGEFVFFPSNVARVVVVLGAAQRNALFVTDFDPWSCERRSAPDGEKKLRELPKPSVCGGRGLALWQDDLLLAPKPLLLKDARLDFLPHEDWDPRSIDKAKWRDCPFERASKATRKGIKNGILDRDGRLWCWDPGHRAHWDVQHHDDDNDDYMNVVCEGTITKAYAG